MKERPTTSDAALLAAAETDAGAFRIVYDRHCEAILGFFVRRGVDYHTAPRPHCRNLRSGLVEPRAIPRSR